MIAIVTKLAGRVLRRVLPEVTAKAAPVKGRCVAGCGGDGVWRESSGRALCC